MVLPPLSLHGVQGNTPIALDEVHHRLFVGTRRPAQLVVLNTETGRQVAAIDIKNDADDLFYDPQSGGVYISCGEGFVDVIQQLSPERYELRDQIATATGARTSTFSAALREMLVGVPGQADRPARILVLPVTK